MSGFESSRVFDAEGAALTPEIEQEEATSSAGALRFALPLPVFSEFDDEGLRDVATCADSPHDATSFCARSRALSFTNRINPRQGVE